MPHELVYDTTIWHSPNTWQLSQLWIQVHENRVQLHFPVTLTVAVQLVPPLVPVVQHPLEDTEPVLHSLQVPGLPPPLS